MKITEAPIKGLLIVEPRVFRDSRGYFFESFHKKKFNEANGRNIDFVQDNQSMSAKGVLRGLHFQNPPFAQGKLVSVVQGSVLDVAVDLRKDSPSYGQHFSIELSGTNNLAFWIPEGFAHGFVALENDTIFSYKCTNFYHPESEDAIIWNDGDLDIKWPVTNPIVSEKDLEAQSFSNFESQF